MVPSVSCRDAGHGYDELGLSARAVRLGLSIVWPLYRYYFRVESHGIEHLPASGPGIVAANHSGMLPFDAVMIGVDIALHTHRVPRALADHLVAGLPFVSIMMQRIGAIGGTPENARAMLAANELLMVFPEGVPGISKPAAKKYQLAHWRPGHVELALRNRVPVYPAAVIGAEEQFPFVHNSKPLGRLVGAPHVPITFFPVPILPVPLPVKYHIHYGPALTLEGDPDDPAAVAAGAERTQRAVEALIEDGLRRRHGVFS